jgi:DNA-binding transcriptional LysR family regulator
MEKRADFDKIELTLIRVLHTLITERSVSRAALKLQTTQPAVSAQLKRLRALTGDSLLVRAGSQMMPTTTAMQLLGPATNLLHEAETLFSPRVRATPFDAAGSTMLFRVAASDYLDPLFLPHLVTHLKHVAPGVQLELMPLSSQFDYRRHLATGDVDLVIGNWLEPPGELHLAKLMSDDVVCLMADNHPLARNGAALRNWTVEKYLACEHVAPSALHPGAAGVIDDHLTALGLARNIVVRSAHFGLIPLMVADTLLVLTTGRLFCSRYVDVLPVRVVRCPVSFPPLVYYQLWHDLTHNAGAMRWFREQVREVAGLLAASGMPQRRRPRAE